MRTLLATCCSVLLAGCAAQQAQPDPDHGLQAGRQIDALRAALPGQYSDFAQVRGKTETAVTDVTIRHLAVDREAAFLISRKFRAGELSQHQLYLFNEGVMPGQLEARFAPLGEAQLSLPVPRILEAAKARFLPGCVLIVNSTPDGLAGQTNPATCRFRHPEAGEVGLVREFGFGRARLSIAERLLDSAGQPVGADGILQLQKHRRFTGWAGLRVDLEAAVDDPAAWRLAGTFDMSDDGRVIPLTDAAGDLFDFGLQLSRVGWRRDQPPILRFAVVDTSNGKIRAYAWAEAESASIGINLDWFQAGLELAKD